MLPKNSTLINTLANWLVLATLVLGVLLVLPFTDGFLSSTKMFLLFAAAIVMGFCFVAYSLQRKTIEIVLSPFTIPLFLFGLAVSASTFFTNNYPVESILSFGGIFVAMVLFILFASTLTTKSLVEKIIPYSGIAGGVLTLFAASQLIGYGPANILNQLFDVGLQTDAGFNVTGSPLFGLQFLLIVAAGMITESVLKKHISKMTAILFPIILCGIAIHSWTILPGKPGALALPSWTASWSVALDTIRSPRAALIGAGPSSYTNIYSRFKPVWVNSTPQWSLMFSQANNLPFTLLTTTGFLGMITWFLIAYQAFKTGRQVSGTNKAIAYMLLVSIALQLILPTSIVILILQAALIIALIAGQHGHLPILRFQALTMSMDNQSSNFHIPAQKVSFPIYFTAGVLSIFLLFTTYFMGRAYAASATFFQAAQAARKNDVIKLYEKQQRAVEINPYLDIYRRQYAITNMVIASSLASKTDITEAEKTQVAELLQQAVREARSATLLDPIDVENSAVLAQIYQNMIGAAEQADQFAVQAYVQAIENDPTNPALRISLGGMMLNQKQYQQAAGIFRQTVDIKPDYANTYYNLAFALKELGSYEDARLSYETLLKLIDPQSEDYAKVKAEMEEVEKIIAEEEAKNPKQTTTGEAGAQQPTTQNRTSPSLLDQSLEEDPSDVINNPSNADLTNPPSTNLGEQLESTPTPAPATP